MFIKVMQAFLIAARIWGRDFVWDNAHPDYGSWNVFEFKINGVDNNTKKLGCPK